MSFSRDQASDEVMSEINMTPFVDIMLVLLIIFLVTLPLVHQSVNIELPKVDAQRHIEPQTPLRISVDKDGRYRVDEQMVSKEGLRNTLQDASSRTPKPVVLLYADKDSRYEWVAELLSLVHQSGLGKVGFISHAEK